MNSIFCHVTNHCVTNNNKREDLNEWQLQGTGTSMLSLLLRSDHNCNLLLADTLALEETFKRFLKSYQCVPSINPIKT